MLAAESRFRRSEEIFDGPKSPDYFDIKGNTFKNTLIPRETAETRASMTTSHNGFKKAPVTPSKPKGYLRSGAILFDNIAQYKTDTKPQRTPHVVSRNNRALTDLRMQEARFSVESKNVNLVTEPEIKKGASTNPPSRFDGN